MILKGNIYEIGTCRRASIIPFENEIRNGEQGAPEIGLGISVQAGFGALGKVMRGGSCAVQRPRFLAPES